MKAGIEHVHLFYAPGANKCDKCASFPKLDWYWQLFLLVALGEILEPIYMYVFELSTLVHVLQWYMKYPKLAFAKDEKMNAAQIRMKYHILRS